MLLENFFQLTPVPENAVYGTYNAQVVILSYLVASLASYVALDTTGRLRTSEESPISKTGWLIAGAFAMGMGIWTMHFIGMLAFDMPMPMYYEPKMTAFSMVIAIVASALAFYLVKKRKLKLLPTIGGGVLMGLGIASMHYTGMAAMIGVKIHYLPGLFFLSILIAIATSEAALWLMIKTAETKRFKQLIKIISALVMGVAVCGMHYTGMAAAVFTHLPAASSTTNVSSLSSNILAFYIAISFTVIVLIALAVSLIWMNILGAKNKKLMETESFLKQKSSDLSHLAEVAQAREERITAILTAAADGIIVIDEKGEIEICNRAAAKILESTEKDLISQNILSFLEANHTKLTLEVLKNKKNTLFELTGKSRKGKKFPLEMSVSQSSTGNKNLFIIVFRDMTEKKKAEDHLNSLNQQLVSTARLAGMEQRNSKKYDAKPLNIYEVHLGSWKKQGQDFLNYRVVAHELAKYCQEMGYTHVELMPIAEHPLDESWGYQVTGYYAVTSRYGTPEDFQYFVNYLHKHKIGVIIDWVPGHFPTDDFALAQFDGTSIYEHCDPRQGMHPHWNTCIFNFGRHEVSNFMIANALFWFDKMHIDGLRVDAVASMLYLDYGREEGNWIPNQYGGRENLETIEFLKHLNSVVHQRFPGVMMIAEESTAFPGVSHPVEHGGLGFDMKWNMGWMNDTLRYIAVDPFFRHYHQNDLTFGLIYAFSEKFILVFSHDEVVHGKNALISKMPGDMWQKFANLRLLLSYMMCQPGKKLLFMGAEIAQWNEWYCKVELEWNLLTFPTHKGVQNMVKEINHFYLEHGELWERDFDHTGFEWVDFGDHQNCVISYLRKGSLGQLLCVHHFTPQYHPEYHIRLGNVKKIEEIFNSDAEKFGGSGKHNTNPQIFEDSVKIQLAPLATMIFRVQF